MSGTDPAYLEKALFRASSLIWDVRREVENGVFVNEAAQKRLADCERELRQLRAIIEIAEAA